MTHDSRANGRVAVWMLALMMVTVTPAGAQDAEKRGACWVPPTKAQSGFGAGVYFEQDSALPWLTPWKSDQNYTMGLAFPFRGEWIHKAKIDTLQRYLDCLTGIHKAHNDRINNAGDDAYQDFSMVFGHTAFTPRRLDLSTPIHDDRPYASLLFLSTARTTVNAFSRTMLRSDLTIGILGLRIGERVQTRIHTTRREAKGPGALTPYDPMGWTHQISDGGEPTAKYTVSVAKAARETEFHDVSVHAEGSVGYYTNVAAGASLRAGWLRSPFWALASNPLSVGNQRLPLIEGGEAEQSVDEIRSKKDVEFAAFVSGRMRLVGYNALMQGQFRHSEVRMNAGQITRVVLEGETGVSIGWKACAGLLTLARRSAEFSIGRVRSHTFGGVHLVCAGGGSGRKN